MFQPWCQCYRSRTPKLGPLELGKPDTCPEFCFITCKSVKTSDCFKSLFGKFLKWGSTKQDDWVSKTYYCYSVFLVLLESLPHYHPSAYGCLHLSVTVTCLHQGSDVNWLYLSSCGCKSMYYLSKNFQFKAYSDLWNVKGEELYLDILDTLNLSVQFSHSVVSNSLWPHGLQHARLPCPSPTPGLIQTHVHCVGDAIQPSYPLSSPSPSALNLSQYQGLFQWVSSSHQVAKVLEFQLQHQSSNEYSGLISFKIDWLDLLVVQRTLKSLLQHHSSKASMFQRSAFFMSPTLTSIHDHWKNHSFD